MSLYNYFQAQKAVRLRTSTTEYTTLLDMVEQLLPESLRSRLNVHYRCDLVSTFWHIKETCNGSVWEKPTYMTIRVLFKEVFCRNYCWIQQANKNCRSLCWLFKQKNDVEHTLV